MVIVAVMVLGLCCAYIVSKFNQAGAYVVAKLYSLGCALAITGMLLGWPESIRVPIYVSTMGFLIYGGMHLRRHP